MKNENVKMGMGMMEDMMQSMMKGAGGMPEMCMKMMQQMTSAGEGANAGGFASPEMRGLFEEWERGLEEELIKFVKDSGKTTPSDISAKLKISQDTVLLLVGKLAREGKLIIGGIRVAE
jgi:hypothetical protein